MTDSDGIPDTVFDAALIKAHSKLVNDLATLLDVEAGLRDAMIARRHADLVRDLHNVLDVDAGLDAIVAPEPTRPPLDAEARDPEPNEIVRERTVVEQGQTVMPFYLICDVSHSMYSEIPALNDGIRQLLRAIVAVPSVEHVAQVSIITFSGEAKVVAPMSPVSDMEVPPFAAEGVSNYGTAFQALAQAIERDVARLKEQGYKVYRPCAFFLTDGLPTDRDWHHIFTRTLTYDRRTGQGMKAYPIFVPFGFREAQKDVLRQLAYPPDRGKWYQAKGANIKEGLKGILDIIMKTVVISGESLGGGRPAIIQQAPDPGSGIEQGDSGYDPDYLP
jgi:uncharacterized protein YegL